MISWVLCLSLFSIPTFAVISKNKCANVAANAVGFFAVGGATQEGQNELYFEANENIITPKEKPKDLKVKKENGKTEYSSASLGAVVTFEEVNGLVKKVTQKLAGTTVATLDSDCNLEQTIEDDKNVIYDNTLCLNLADRMNRFTDGFSADDVKTCEKIGTTMSEIINKRSFDIGKETKQKHIIPKANEYFSSLPLSFLNRCARQLSFQNRFDGATGVAREFTKEWYKNAFKRKSAKAPADSKPNISAQQ